MKTLACGALAGALAGAVVLGVCGRLLMRLVAVVIVPEAVGFSWGGSLEVVAVGLLFGATAGLLWAPLARWVPPRLVGPALGVVTFGGIAVGSPSARGAASGVPLPGLALFLVLCLLFGWTAHGFARRWTPPS